MRTLVRTRAGAADTTASYAGAESSKPAPNFDAFTVFQEELRTARLRSEPEPFRANFVFWFFLYFREPWRQENQPPWLPKRYKRYDGVTLPVAVGAAMAMSLGIALSFPTCSTQMLEENFRFIKAIAEQQNLGRVQEVNQ